MPTYKQDIKATTGNSPVNQVAGAASSFNPDQSMAGYMLQQGGGLSGMVDSMQNYRNQKKQALNASKGVGVLSGAAAQRSNQAAGAVPGSSGGDISELSDRVSALEGNQDVTQPNNQGSAAGVANAVFPNSAQNAAQGMFGSTDQRQNSVNASPLFQKGYTKTTKKLPKKADNALSDNLKMVLEKHRRQNNQPIQEDSKKLDSKFKKQNVTKKY